MKEETMLENTEPPPIAAPVIIADPHGLRELGVEVGDVPAIAEHLKLSKRGTREIIETKWQEIRYVDRRIEGLPAIKTRWYAIEDIAALVPRFLAWRAEIQARHLAREDQDRDPVRLAEREAARKARRAAKQASQGKPKPKPLSPKPSPKPSPRPSSGPRSLPPMVARGRERAPTVEVYRRVAR